MAGVRVDGEVLPADRVVLALGPWTGLARGWVKSAPPIFGSLGHSIVIQASQPLSAHCLFVNHRSKSGGYCLWAVLLDCVGEVCWVMHFARYGAAMACLMLV